MDIILKWDQIRQAATADGTIPDTPQEARTTRSTKMINNTKDLLGGTTNIPLMAMETVIRNLMMTNTTTQAGTGKNIQRIIADLITLSFIHFEKRDATIHMMPFDYDLFHQEM